LKVLAVLRVLKVLVLMVLRVLKVPRCTFSTEHLQHISTVSTSTIGTSSTISTISTSASQLRGINERPRESGLAEPLQDAAVSLDRGAPRPHVLVVHAVGPERNLDMFVRCDRDRDRPRQECAAVHERRLMRPRRQHDAV